MNVDAFRSIVGLEVSCKFYIACVVDVYVVVACLVEFFGSVLLPYKLLYNKAYTHMFCFSGGYYQ